MRFEPNLNCHRKAEEFKSASLESAQTTLTGNSYICILYTCVLQNLSLLKCAKRNHFFFYSVRSMLQYNCICWKMPHKTTPRWWHYWATYGYYECGSAAITSVLRKITSSGSPSLALFVWLAYYTTKMILSFLQNSQYPLAYNHWMDIYVHGWKCQYHYMP